LIRKGSFGLNLTCIYVWLDGEKERESEREREREREMDWRRMEKVREEKRPPFTSRQQKKRNKKVKKAKVYFIFYRLQEATKTALRMI
jgi:hypothetical protein